MCVCMCLCICVYVYVCFCVFVWMTVCIFEIAGCELSLSCILKCDHSLCSLACVYWSTDSKGADTDDQSISYSCD